MTCLFRGVNDSPRNDKTILTETSQVGELRRVIGQRTHDPVCGGLPHGIEDAATDVQENAADIRPVVYVQLGVVANLLCDRRTRVLPRCTVRWSRNTFTLYRGHLLLVEVCPDVDDEHHCEEHAPARECAEPTRETGLVEEETDTDGAEDLRHPVDEVVQRPGPDGE